MAGKTLFDKIWEHHHVGALEGGVELIYIDRHLVHEVTSPQAFEGLRLSNRRVRRPLATLAVCDHNVPTGDRSLPIPDEQSRLQIEALRENCKDFGVPFFDLRDKRQGIVHVVGPEQGLTQPGMTIVCGDSHTATHGAFGALAFGIGTSEVEHVLSTQTLPQKKPKSMRIVVQGRLGVGLTAKDIILGLIGRIGTAGGTGYVIEYAGEAIESLSMEGRMTVCNMSIEAGARAGLIAPDEKTFAYVKGRAMAPKGKHWDEAVAFWRTLYSDADCNFDTEHVFSVEDIEPQVTWGTTPEDVVGVNGFVPKLEDFTDQAKRSSVERALQYMGLSGGEKMTDLTFERVFIGSCTNGRIEDLREVAEVVKGHHVKEGVRAMIVPGSGIVREQAEGEGLSSVFIEAGFEWREPGCSMCLGMNEDQLNPEERCASTSNRNFEGRQGKGGRTHLMSPAMAACASITGRVTDIREFVR